MICVMQPTTTERIAAQVRQLMKDNGVSQAQLGQVLGIAQPNVSRRLSGRTPFDVNELAAIGELLGVPAWRLMEAAA